MAKKQEWVPEATLAEMIKEEPVESRFTYGNWMMYIKPKSGLLGTYELGMYYHYLKIKEALPPDLNNDFMVYTFKSFEEAYEGMLLFLESVKK